MKSEVNRSNLFHKNQYKITVKCELSKKRSGIAVLVVLNNDVFN